MRQLKKSENLFDSIISNEQTQQEIADGKFNIFQGATLAVMNTMGRSAEQNLQGSGLSSYQVQAVKVPVTYEQFFQRIRQNRQYTLDEIVQYGSVDPNSVQVKVAIADQQSRMPVFRSATPEELTKTVQQLQA